MPLLFQIKVLHKDTNLQASKGTMAVALNPSQSGSEQILMLKDSHPHAVLELLHWSQIQSCCSFKYSSQNPQPQTSSCILHSHRYENSSPTLQASFLTALVSKSPAMWQHNLRILTFLKTIPLNEISLWWDIWVAPRLKPSWAETERKCLYYHICICSNVYP